MTGRTEQPWISPAWDAPANVIALTTTCRANSGGVNVDFNLAAHVGDTPEKVQRNRERLRQSIGCQIGFQWLEQIHGTAAIEAQRDGRVPEADAAYTSEPDLACCVLTADCLPVFLAATTGQAVAVAHAGWRGLAAGVLENTVARFPVPGEQVIAWLGPAIGPCHFQVGSEVRDVFLDADDGSKVQVESCFTAAPEAGKFFADLYGLATIRLMNLGVKVAGGGLCTFCEKERFYSYRRQRNTGRMASLIYLKS